MNTKQISCIDEQLSVDVTQPLEQSENEALIIAVSITRTYLVSDSAELRKRIHETWYTEPMDELIVR